MFTLAAAIMAACLSDAPARAGTLTVLANATNCSALAPVTNAPDLALSPAWGCPMLISNVNEDVYPQNTFAQLISYAPAGISIVSATVAGALADGGCCGSHWWTGSVWAGAGDTWTGTSSFTDSFPAGSTYWGMQMWCVNTSCAKGSMSATSVTLTGVENQAPSITAEGSDNLWYQGGHYIWNPPGDPWPLTLWGADPSGVCSFDATVGAVRLACPMAAPNQHAWQQCPNPNIWTPDQGAEVDTTSYVPSDGALPLTAQAVNAADDAATVSKPRSTDRLGW